MSRSVSPDIVVHYPCSDDQPMAESEFQLVPMLYVLTVLRTHFRGREDVYVGGDMFVYYEEGNSRAVVAPDVFVVIGAPKRAEHPRDTYKLWEEPKGPDFVLEVLSSRTWKADLGSKRALYASLGVTEYWLFDPTREHLLSPPLRGMRLAGREYRELPVLQLATSALTLRSEVLGLDLLLNRGALFFRDPATGEDLLGHEEERYARQAAEVSGPAGDRCPRDGAGPGRAGGRCPSRRGDTSPAGGGRPRGGRGADCRAAGAVAGPAARVDDTARREFLGR